MLPRWPYWSSLPNTRIDLAYDGARFHGYQIQPHLRTIEGEVVRALSTILDHPVKLISAGRTDAGVHAAHQVANFHSDKPIDCYRLKGGVQRLTDDDITIREVTSVSDGFHARFHATARVYRYFFTNHPIPMWARHRITVVPIESIDLSLDIGSLLVGTHDFKNLSRVVPKTKSTIRTLTQATLTKQTLNDLYSDRSWPIYCIEIEGNSFLHGMVRHIVGALFELLKKNATITDFNRLFTAAHTLSYNYTSAPAPGLCLTQIKYS